MFHLINYYLYLIITNKFYLFNSFKKILTKLELNYIKLN